jgi:hypoxanthine-DNA glycosylase
MTAFLVHPFAPVYRNDSRVLILGTMPSPASRRAAFYYGHPRNRFWKVLAAVFDAPVPESVEEKTGFVYERGLALWDVLASCHIEGAVDQTIRGGTVNDFSRIIRESRIHTVVCAGKKAWTLYQKEAKQKTGLDAVPLPSTSPANCAVSFGELCAAYRYVKDILDERTMPL